MHSAFDLGQAKSPHWSGPKYTRLSIMSFSDCMGQILNTMMKTKTVVGRDEAKEHIVRRH